MRFTKHLTAIACAVALVSTAPAADAQSLAGTGLVPHEDIETNAQNFMSAWFSGITKTKKEQKLDAANLLKARVDDHSSFWAGTNKNVKYPKNLLPDYACHGDNLSCKTTKDAIYAISHNVGIEYNDVIIGVTAGGERKILYCGTARPCTAGSLNKAAIAQGLEFMVPADMLETAGVYEGAWEDVAAILWSEEFATTYKDTNAESARDTLATNANVYAANRKTSQQAAAKQQTNDGNNNTTVDCDALCESEKL